MEPAEPAEPPDLGDAATDWFGNPLHAPRTAVPCPRCGAAFVDRASFEAHLRTTHGVRSARRSTAPSPRDDVPALGRRRRSPLARRLARTPLVLVVTANVALILVAIAALDALGPTWWDELRSQPWGGAVIVPMLWPTILFLLLRGID